MDSTDTKPFPSFARGLAGAVLASILLSTGCGSSSSSTFPVRGVVRFPDGKLLRTGSVEFEIVGAEVPVTATGRIGADGSFRLGTFASDDGALAGKHRVVVIADYSIGNGAERPGMIPESEVDEKYRRFSTSGLIYEVKPQSNNLVIEIGRTQPVSAKVDENS